MGGKENRAGKEWENLAERSFWGLRRNVGTDKESEMTLEGGKKREGRCRGMILADSLSGAETQSRCITFPLVYFFLVSSQAPPVTPLSSSLPEQEFPVYFFLPVGRTTVAKIILNATLIFLTP